MPLNLSNAHSFNKRFLLSIPAAMFLATLPSVAEAITFNAVRVDVIDRDGRNRINVLESKSFNPDRDLRKGNFTAKGVKFTFKSDSEEWKITFPNRSKERRVIFDADNSPYGWEFFLEGKGKNEQLTLTARQTDYSLHLEDFEAFKDLTGETPGAIAKDGAFINGRFVVTGRNATLTAKTVPEPFSTTAAVGLAIAGVTRTLKKRKKTDDE